MGPRCTGHVKCIAVGASLGKSHTSGTACTCDVAYVCLFICLLGLCVNRFTEHVIRQDLNSAKLDLLLYGSNDDTLEQWTLLRFFFSIMVYLGCDPVNEKILNST